MESLSPKDLKKLAAACRAAGIETFKGFGVEFTLAPKPQAKVAKSKAKVNPGPDKEIETDSLDPESLLFWSITGESDEAVS